ncbi:MAG TPA: TM0106 family RecB-like putative nuclease [Acidimicrobiales bacterium]|nr:TM0106 family RecB-like putative nuclease [Acidimicrobiales bacterium]
MPQTSAGPPLPATAPALLEPDADALVGDAPAAPATSAPAGPPAQPVVLGHTAVTGCAQKSYLDANPPETPADERGPGADRLAQNSRDLRSETLNTVAKVHQGDASVVVIPDRADQRDAATAAAMAAGARIIVGGELPARNGRSGRPDLLLRVGDAPKDDGNWEYAPVLVVNHKALQGEAKAVEHAVGTLSAPTATVATDLGVGSPNTSDSLRLAHLSRLLDDHGHGPGGTERRAAVIDSAQRVIWRDLAAPKTMFVTDPATGTRRKDSAIAAYDVEFERRMAAATGKAAPPGPALCSDCDSCSRRTHCRGELEASDHITLLRGITPDRAQAHYAHGITTRAQLAGLDWRAATLVDAKIERLDGIVAAARKDDPNKPAATYAGTNEATAAAFAAAGIETAGDLAALDDATVAYGAKGSPRAYDLAGSIDAARVAIADRPYLKRGAAPLVVPRADMEFDIDLENSTSRVYMWGLRRTFRDKPTKPVSDYAVFTAWEDKDEAEAAAFASLWSRVTAARKTASHMNRTLAVYHYGDHETKWMRELAHRHAGRDGVPSPDEVEAFVSSPQWVDMHKVASESLLWPTKDNGLKAIAHRAGFAWSDTSSSGLAALAWHAEATKADSSVEERAVARTRLEKYNAEDCGAMYAVRDWLAQVAPRIRPVESLDPQQAKASTAA